MEPLSTVDPTPETEGTVDSRPALVVEEILSSEGTSVGVAPPSTEVPPPVTE